MHSAIRNVSILASQLKAHGIRNVVVSSGARHTALVATLASDPFFELYSIVDERSASFFAIGIIEATGDPAAICATSGTAVANYYSAACEAFYQQLPLLILSAERNPYYLFQQEEQMIPQEGMFGQMCKASVSLPHVRDEKDAWYCERLCNDALNELTHRESGPVHINFVIENEYPMSRAIYRFEDGTAPETRVSRRLSLEDGEERWAEWAERLAAGRTLVVYGQAGPLTDGESEAVERFCETYDAVVAIDLLSNLHVASTVNSFGLMRSIGEKALQDLLPDTVITLGGNQIADVKARIGKYAGRFRHWHVSPEGRISDPFKCIPDVIECRPATFFDLFARLAPRHLGGRPYLDAWKSAAEHIGPSGFLSYEEVIPYSELKVAQEFMRSVPEGALVHLANSNCVRSASFFALPETVEVYCNRGTNGIDGSMSSFVAQAYLTKKPSYLLVGDLSFFYDMNALRNEYLGDNMRIMVVNNSGGSIFYPYLESVDEPSLGHWIAAGHETSVEGWAEDRGFVYVAAHNDADLSAAMGEFRSSDTKMLVEVFTEKSSDAHGIIEAARRHSFGDPAGIKSVAKKVLPISVQEQIKKLKR